MHQRKLEQFEPNFRNEKLKSKIALISWYLFFNPFIQSRFNFSIIRIWIARIFGATIGHQVKFKAGVKIHKPKNLKIGDFSWIGEGVLFINHERVTIGSNVCISQKSIICSGGHDYRKVALDFLHKPIIIKDGAWVCLNSKVLPGVTIGECSVIAAGEIVRRSIPDHSMLIAGEIRPIEPPKLS